MKRLIAITLFSGFLIFTPVCVEGWGFGGNTLSGAASIALSCGNRSVAIVIDPLLVAPIRTALDQFEADLCANGYTAIENSDGFSDPTALRNYLQQLYNQPETGLAGTILIGDIPHPYQWITLIFSNPDIPPLEEEAISFQYYADLNGTFAKSPGYVSPGGNAFSFDLHSGAVDWEIWVGVLPYYKGNLELTIDALNRYFTKNHAYRTGLLKRPNVFLQISELLQDVKYLREGPYTWTPFSDESNARLYAGDVSGGYLDLANGTSDFTVVGAHGYWGASGQLSIADVETNPVKTIMFWSSGCAIGDLDQVDNFLTSILYSPTSDVLIAKGTTNNSGGMGNNLNGFYGHNIATAISTGASFGDAILSHVNVPLISPWSESREFHFGTPVLLGDPTLQRELNLGFTLNTGLNDAWYDPATDGQGFFITVFPDLGVVSLAWFTYDTELPAIDAIANLGDAGHRWLTALGPIDGNQVLMDIDITSGGIFDTPTEIQHTEPPGSDGILVLTFDSCNSGTVEYDIPSINRQGIVPIRRVADDNIVICEALNTD